MLERMRKAYPNKLILAGFDEMLLPAAVLGIDGAIGSTYNVNGLRAKEIFRLAKEGKVAEALEIQHVTNDLIEGILANGLYGTIKEIMKLQGVELDIAEDLWQKLLLNKWLELRYFLTNTLLNNYF